MVRPPGASCRRSPYAKNTADYHYRRRLTGRSGSRQFTSRYDLLWLALRQDARRREPRYSQLTFSATIEDILGTEHINLNTYTRGRWRMFPHLLVQQVDFHASHRHYWNPPHLDWIQRVQFAAGPT